MGDSLLRTPMNRLAKFDAASLILGGEIRNRTNTQNYKQTNSKRYIHTAYRHVWIISSKRLINSAKIRLTQDWSAMLPSTRILSFSATAQVKNNANKKLNYHRGTARLAILIHSCYVSRAMGVIEVSNRKNHLQRHARALATVPFDRPHTICGRTPTCDGQMDGHTITAHAVLLTDIPRETKCVLAYVA